MRIQHNIAALNSYRNLTGNNNAVGKNLEKLSSGYRINRAGDDAAGLAISEKMRAQITGLETAQKNANDGISLVQTAEGALTEVHSMLNRMVELADQSANGTYDNATDRSNLQKELNSLKSEIDRISEGTNFNGINLLDGSLGGGSSVLGGADIAVGKSLGTAGLTGGTAAADDKFIVSSWGAINGGNGNYTIATGTIAADGSFTAGEATTDRDIIITREYDVTDDDGNTVTKQENFVLKLDDVLSGVTKDGKAKTAGSTVSGQDLNISADGDVYTLDLTSAGLGKIQLSAVAAGADTDILGALNGATTTITEASGSGALTLQIGDTAQDFNQLSVSIGDMSSRALGLNTVDISTQAGAKSAVDAIKNAINSVSSTRGDLGAIQNRLEHTINNLSVTTENMTAAESRIRDVDMAKEMMSYTKNNILVQASQAMLAQANQIPQGVLQLLQ
ncbi:flagellin [Faecalicatena contorta]|uniref:Flagellin n=1 Tax=Faecalicatena contorta TaxID=39482 RepID=A0A316A6Q3_9FIRM|nr:flagellin [Faecalicatena contorta]PWJ52494.1 flagellin [Faecalicatena contorta]SUQ12772.1 flagellin [Faecalicatena contorta]